MKNPTTDQRAVIPMHLKDVPKGTLSAILREVGIEKDAFINAK